MVSRQSPSHGWMAANRGEPSNVRMEQQPNLETSEIQNHSPQDIERFITQITKAVDWAHKHKGAPDYFPDDEEADRIVTSFLLSDIETWEKKFTEAQRRAAHFYHDWQTYRSTIAAGISTQHVKITSFESIPELDKERYLKQNITPVITKKVKPRATTKIKRSVPSPLDETITQFITRRAPSINYLQGFISISRHTKNRLSGRGRKVYPYGQEYMARNLELSHRTVDRIFSWLRQHHIIFKRSSENQELHKSATWFVCTSWKQSTYYLDPQGRRPKKRSPRSPRK